MRDISLYSFTKHEAWFDSEIEKELDKISQLVVISKAYHRWVIRVDHSGFVFALEDREC